MKAIGYLVVIGALVGGFLYFTGRISGSADVQLTGKGKQEAAQGVQAVREQSNKHLQDLENSLKEQ